MLMHDNTKRKALPEGKALPTTRPMNRNYAVRFASPFRPTRAACAAANRAIGTRYGEQLT